LIVTGDTDAFIPVTVGRRLAHVIPHAELVLLPGADHMLLSNRSAEVANVVEDFLGRVAGRELLPSEQVGRPG
jgi:pimeloyl-ACP methyl ester carboxylesterase